MGETKTKTDCIGQRQQLSPPKPNHPALYKIIHPDAATKHITKGEPDRPSWAVFVVYLLKTL
jgi:hypothetical protein